MGTVESAAATVERPRKPVVSFGPFTFDPNSQLLRCGPDELTLPPRVLGVLECLLARAGDLVPRQEIIDSVWKDAFVTDTSLAEAVSVLRQALGDDPQSPAYIQTVHRRGYRFVAPVERTGPPPAEAGAPGDRVDRSGADTSASIGGHAVAWTVAAFSVRLAMAAVWHATHQRAPAPLVARFRIEPAPETMFDRRAPALALSPDGDAVVWSGCDGSGCRLYLRRL